MRMRTIVCLTAVSSVAPVATAQLAEYAKVHGLDSLRGDYCGSSVAVSGNVAIAGSPEDTAFGEYTNRGSAYLFDIRTLEQLAMLTPSDGGKDFYRFGASVAIDGGLAAVGAQPGSGTGAVYVYDVGTGQELYKITHPTPFDRDYFGGSVALEDGRLLVGARDLGQSGSALAFLFDAATGQLLHELKASGGAVVRSTVDLDGDVAIIGAESVSDYKGAAYLFDLVTGQEIARLTASNGKSQDGFGHAVGIDGGRAVVTAIRSDDPEVEPGLLYVFDVATGTELSQLTPTIDATGQWFGGSVALQGRFALVGAQLDDVGGQASGSAYLFDVTTGEQLQKLVASDKTAQANFGRAVALSGGVAVVGAPGDDGGRGAAHLFSGSLCSADVNGDGLVDTLDVLAFLNAWAGGDDMADWDGNGTVNTLDMLAFLNDWAAGC